MKLADNKLRTVSWAILVLLVCLSLILGVFIKTVSADTKPYIKANGADVFAGGWFENGGCNTALGGIYQTGRGANDDKLGGILTFAESAPARGSSSQYGAFALGLIEGTGIPAPGNQYGFASRGNTALSFANTGVPGGNWGGMFEGSSAVAHCIPNYYSQNTDTTAAISINPVDFTGTGHRWFSGSPSFSINSAVSIAPGTNVTLFVNGNLYINANISYAGGYTAANTPKFAVVVRGNIYIGQAVNTLTGFYSAQPSNLSSPGTQGRIWTCAPGATDPTPAFLRGCTNRLTVNGAVNAAQVMLVRTGGDVLDNNTNPAEVFNYTPEMIINGGFFDDGTTGNALKIDSVISLPPVF